MQPSERLIGGLGSSSDDAQRITCVHADRCGGCPVIALPYGEQLALKRGRVVQSLSRYPALELVYTEPVQPAEPVVEYRSRAKMIVAPGGKLGLYAKGGGHQVVDIPSCRVVASVVSVVAALLRERIKADEAAKGPLAPIDSGGSLRAVDLREVRGRGGEHVLVTLVVQRDRAHDRAVYAAAAEELMRAEPRVLGVALNFHEGDSPQILGSETVVVHGAASAPDQIGGATHEATYGSFVQAHRGQAERVHKTIIEVLGIGKAPKRPRVLDLYGGSGAIALALAGAGADVQLVESFAPAVAQVNDTAKKAGLSVRGEAGDVASALRRFAEQKQTFEGAVVNPPRRGTSALARELLARLELPAVAYVSCDPDTLARDLDHFTRLGYSVASVRPLDMIPLTDEVETIALLRRTGLVAPKVLWEDDEVFVVEKGAHEPTTPQGEYVTSLVARAKKLADAGDAVPVNRIDVGTSGLVLFARRAADAPKWQAALQHESARKIYLAGARGITPSKGAITRDLREDGKMYSARTRYRRLAVASGHSVLRVVPEQGRTHQIRRHLAAIGHPILGDDRYGHAPTNRFFEEKNVLDRTFLHCVRLELTHPNTGNRLIIEAPLPGDLKSVLERTSGPGTLRFLDHKQALGHSGVSSLPPPPTGESTPSELLPSLRDSASRLSILDVDSSTPTIHPQLQTDDDAS
ncbi:MAG: RsmD family RNA methyltransferase [Labilithrix sp.]|nr:RsmD family RNA methyltransferase [Labilithrix sp.]MCW5817010.1 RsmD family RNA methyltransferase [Labilithrix sp.]